MKVFITGGAGFIGSQLCLRLLNDGHVVTAYDNLLLGKEEFLSPCQTHKNFKFIKNDLLTDPHLRDSLYGFDFVFHLAANSDIQKGGLETDRDLNLNLMTTFKVLDAMRHANVKKIAFASTSAIYGDVKQRPTPENYGPLKPISFYGASKLGAESFITSFAHMFGFKSWIFRFANIVGPNLTHGVIYDFAKRLKANPQELKVLGDGSQKKSYLHVEDCMDAMLFSIKNSEQEVSIFNLASQGTTTVKFIADTVVKKMNPKTRIVYGTEDRGWKGDVPYTWLDGSLLNQLGWKANLSSDQAVEKSIEQHLRAEGLL